MPDDRMRGSLITENIRALHALQREAAGIRGSSTLSEAEHNKLFETEAKDLRHHVTTTYPADMSNHYKRLMSSQNIIQETVTYLRNRNARRTPSSMDTQRGMLQMIMDRMFQARSRSDDSTLHDLHASMMMQPVTVSMTLAKRQFFPKNAC